MPLFINKKECIYHYSNAQLVSQDPCYKNINGKPVLIYFTNVASADDAVQTAKTVFVAEKPLCHKNSYFSKSFGDEAGDLLGLNSHTIQGKATFQTASPNVFIEGIPAVKLGDLMVSNNANTPPTPVFEK
ncbi:MAG: DUF4150 domain-containing protein [Gammaproteobacteria bacterium]